MKKIGILGGTFNPVHKGHTALCEYCKREIGLDEIILIPTALPPHKESRELVGFSHRLNMCRLATVNFSGYSVSDIEHKRGGKSYTYETLTSLKEIYPDDELYFITGADMFLTLDKWKNPEIIFSKATLTAVPRNDADISVLEKYYNSVIKPMGAKAVILPQLVMSVSSTFIRENIDSFNVVSKLLDRNVYDYIVKNKLYRM